MEYGVQRRNIILKPPTEVDLLWFVQQFEQREVWEMFGLEGPGKLQMLRQYRGGNLVVGILHTVVPHKRIGFVVMFPPDQGRDYWEFGYAIGDPKDRDAFSALNATDAMGYYMFECLRVEAMGWRQRADNHAAIAIVKRIGYQPDVERELAGHKYIFYRIDRPGWEKRKGKLERGEAEHPSGIGAAFVVHETPPFDPIVPAGKEAAAPAPPPASQAKRAASAASEGGREDSLRPGTAGRPRARGRARRSRSS